MPSVMAYFSIEESVACIQGDIVVLMKLDPGGSFEANHPMFCGALKPLRNVLV